MSFVPDSSSTTENELTVNELLKRILLELKILNKYNELGFDEIIDEESIHEDRRR